MSRGPRIALDGATVLLTGASGGLGQAMARSLAARGARLLLAGRRADLLDELAAELHATVLVGDLADRDEVRRLGEAAVGAGVDVLVANAGMPASGELSALTAEQIDRMLDVNLRAPIMLAEALAPAMTARGRGQLVFVSSLAGQVTSPASPLYSATKFGLRGFALGLREDLRAHGVGVSVLLPGFIRDAGMFADADVRLPPGSGTRAPADVAAAVLRAIDRDPAEIYVAPLSLRLGAAIAAVAPAPVAAVSRLLGSHAIAERMANAQRHLR